MKKSAGILLYRLSEGAIEVLLVHPSGNYNRRAPWGIPKGLPNPDESLENAARRETLEETGIKIKEPLTSLGFIDYKKSSKRIFCFAVKVDYTCKPGELSWEIDKAEFFSIDEAKKLIHPDQAEFLERLTQAL